MKKLILVFPVMIMILSCSQANLKKQLQDFAGQEVIVPDRLQATFNGKDTVWNDFASSDAKLVVWFDSIGCSSCQINHMYEWNEILTHSKATMNKFNIVFVFSPKTTKSAVHEVRNSLYASRLDYPVFIDTAASFVAANPVIPADKRFHTFLLDKDNKVVLVGNPVNNESLWQLYKDEIKKLISD